MSGAAIYALPMCRFARSLLALLLLVSPLVLAAGCPGPASEVAVATPTPVEPDTPPTAEPAAEAAPAFAYPAARRGEVVDDYHGTPVPDPYRWLEDPDSDESRSWITAQNKITFGYLEKIAAREPIRQRITELWDYEKYGIPFERGGRYFFTKNDGLQNQSVLYWAESLTGDAKVLLDPNKLSKDGTVSLSGMAISEDGKHLAYGLQSGGSDWQTWQVREVGTGKDLNDRLEWIKFSGATWTHDGKGFFYSRYPKPAEGAGLTGTNYFQKLYYHRLGTAQSEDELIYERPDEKKWGFASRVSDDGRYLIISVWKGTGTDNLVYYRDLGGKARGKGARRGKKVGWSKKGGPKKGAIRGLVTEWKGDFRFIDNVGPVFWFFTDLDAPRGRLVAIDIRKPQPKHWKEIVPQSADTLRGANIVGNKVFARYLKDAKSQIVLFDMQGKRLGEVALPGIGSAFGFGGRRSDKETFYLFTSFTTPGTIYRYDVASGKSEVFRRPEVAFDGNAYEVAQIFYNSKDGTRVPMFVVHKKGLAKNGQNPTYLYGYGGFNASMTPFFSVVRTVWLEMGGILAIPNLRGGGEYGEEWHKAGTKLQKQNVFDDFIAAAEWLIANKYTSPKKLAIAGGSNGGLLVGAAMTQRPDLFGATLPAVGVMDMLRFHKFTIGWAWVDDYGSPDDPEEFKALRAYSPYHNLRSGTAYPATLITTADHDDRVVPAHSFKFAAALQHAHKGDNPVLIRIETRAGHGGGKPTAMRIEEAADKWAFLTATLGIDYPLAK